MLFETPRLRAVLITESTAEQLSLYYTRNDEHLQPWEPLRPSGYHSLDAWTKRRREFEDEHNKEISLRILALFPNQEKIVGACNFTNIARGPFQACNLGYSISKEHTGKGLMTEFVEGAINYVFKELDLHRVMANYMPGNTRSARVLEKLGFNKEGVAKSYLKIAGKWQDHVLTAKINPHHKPGTRSYQHRHSQQLIGEAMFDHVVFGVSDYALSKAFYLQALEVLNVQIVTENDTGIELSTDGKSSLCLVKTEEKPAHLHLAFRANTRQQVDVFYKDALKAGGTSNGAPGLRPKYSNNYYAAFVVDPDGHNVEMVCHEPE